MQLNRVALVSLVNLLLNIAIQSSIIFIPLLGAQQGASDFQVGLIGAAYGGAYLLSSLYSGKQSDRRGRLIFIRVGLLLCTVTFALQLLAKHLLVLMLIRASVGLSLGITMAALVAYAFELGSDMGRFSSYGSIGWIGGAIFAALLKSFNLLFFASAISCAAAFLISLLLPAQTIPNMVTLRKTPEFGAIIKKGFPIYFSVFLRHLGATSVWIILPLYFQSLGIGRFGVGILWGINFVFQALVMRYLEHFNPIKIFAFGQVLSIGVFVSYALVSHLAPLIAVQAFLGVAWACLYVGALLIVLRSGEDRGTASGIFQATLNLCGAVGPFLGGFVAQVWSYRGVMWVAAALGVAGMLIAVPQTIDEQQKKLA